jgi:hypothetical protein
MFQSILEHYRVKHSKIHISVAEKVETILISPASRSSRMFFYKPYTPLHAYASQGVPPGDTELKRIDALMKKGHWEESLNSSLDLINVSLEGLRYLQT